MIQVSVVTPAYNAEKHIAQTIESVKSQTFENWEMLIVDDCSKDSTCQIVEEYTANDSRIKLIRLNENLGVSGARNTAIDKAVGRYIAFLDSDDLWLPQKLERQIAFMNQTNAALSYTAYRQFSKDGEKLINIPNEMSSKSLLKNTAIGCLTVMVDTTKSGDFKMPNLSHCEDICTWYSILNSTKSNAMGLNECLAMYRVGESSLTSSKGKAALKQWNVYRNYFEFSFVKSAYYFFCYAFNAVKKHYLSK